MDDQVSKVSVVVDLELRGKERSGKRGNLLCCIFILKVVLVHFWKVVLYLNFSSDGVRHIHHLCCLVKERIKGRVKGMQWLLMIVP